MQWGMLKKLHINYFKWAPALFYKNLVLTDTDGDQLMQYRHKTKGQY